MPKPCIRSTIAVDETRLPSLPHVLLELIESCLDSNASFEALASIIQKDAGLSARVMAVAGTSRLTRMPKAREFSRLLMDLGLGSIRTIVITAAVQQFFSPFDTGIGRWKGHFWQRSLSCAWSARALAELTGYGAVDEAYQAGLLHRIGQLLFLQKRPGDYLQLLNDSSSDEELKIGERELFGTDCVDMSARLARGWDPDSFLSDAIRYQDEPIERVLDTPPLVKLINLARKLSAGCQAKEQLYREVELLLGLSAVQIETLQEGVAARVAGVTAVALTQQNEVAGSESGLHVDDEESRLQLARRVKELALLTVIQQQLNGSGCLDETLTALFQGFKLLFGLSCPACFLTVSKNGTLKVAAVDEAGSDLIGQFQLQIQPGRSLVTEALIEEKILSSFDPCLPAVTGVVDGQLTELLGSEGLLCIPLSQQQRGVGVLVLGVTSQSAGLLLKQSAMLHLFAAGATGTIGRQQSRLREQEDLLKQQQQRQQVRARKTMHEVNNSLAIIRNYLQVLSLRLGKETLPREQFSILDEEIERVAEMVAHLGDAPTLIDLPQGAVEINELIQDLLALFSVSHFAERRITTRLSLDPAMPPVLSNRNSLKQILTNLIKNAVEALPDGGELSISTRGEVNLDGGSYIDLVVADDGPGIPAQEVSRLFSPLQSSKGRQHSGLGLTIVKSLVSELGGAISCSNKSGGGAEFVILLPRKIV